jgi:predicted DNA repair protein MutK
MVAMLWVGGGILLHGLHELGVHGPEEAVKQAAAAVSRAVPVMKSGVAWIVSAGIAGILGVGVGAVVAPLTERALVPALAYVKKRLRPAPGG